MRNCTTLLKLVLSFLLIFSGLAAFAQVTLTDNGSTVMLANGTVTAIIQKSNGQITSLKLGSLETVSGNIYYSMDGGASYQTPGPCVYSVTSQTADTVDLSFFQVFTSQPHAFDIDVHYVMRSGSSGVYTYAVLSHPASYPATSVGEWRTVWKHPNDGTNFTFENIYVDDARHYQGPSFFDITNATATSIAEVVFLNTGVRANTYFGKYDYNAEYYKIGTWGHASNAHHAGAFVVLGSEEFLNDGPTKQDLTIAEGYVLMHYGRNHYGGSGTGVAAGESWSKIYGPWLLYVNSCPSGADACWADAKAKVQTEQAAWPYSWLTTNSLYPQESGRGTASGKLTVNDSLKPAVNSANAWVGVVPPDSGVNWQDESKLYEYWVKADSAGNFSIPHVRPGTYNLYAFVTGAVGEYSQSGISVTAGGTTSLGNVTWNVVHPGNSIAWEIGVPDRSAAEFRHGNDYFQAFLYNNFSNELPNPINYTVGTSNWATDWNYVHTAYNVGGTLNQWPWNIHFNLASVPASGNATLTLAWASTNSAAEQVFVNDPNMANPPLTDFTPAVGGGNALIREGIHAKYSVDYVTIPVSLLHAGANTITLLQRRGVSGIGNHVMYDYINLELPTASPDFGISASPGSQTVGAGASVPYTVTVTPAGGFTGTVNFSVSGLPSGATGSFNPTSVAGSGSSTLSVTTSSTTPAGTYTLTITGTSGSLSHTSSVTLVVTSPPDFSIAASPGTQTVTAGAGTTYTTTVTAVNGFTGTVNFSVSGLPSGASGSFNPTSVADSGSSSLSVTTSISTPAGTYTLTITGTSGSLVHSTTATLVVNLPPPDFSIAASPGTQTVTAGGGTSYTTTTTAVNGFSGTVNLSVSGLPSGATGSFNPTSVTGSGSSTLSVTTSSSTPAGISTLTISGTSGSLVHSATVTLVVNPVTGLPPGWADLDIGAPGMAGGASFSSGVFTVKGGGADIWGTADHFNYASESLTGNLTITARVASLQNTNSWAKGGVMVRETTASNSAYVYVFVSPSNGVNMQYRPSTGASAVQLAQITGHTAPYWVRLVRSGNTFTGFASADGVTWTQVGSITVTMASNAQEGLAVTAHNNAALNTSTFDNVTVGP